MRREAAYMHQLNCASGTSNGGTVEKYEKKTYHAFNFGRTKF